MPTPTAQRTSLPRATRGTCLLYTSRPIRQAHFRPPRGLFVRGIFCGDAKIVVHRSRMRARQPFCSGGKESFRKNMSNSPSAFVNLPAPARSRRSWVSVIIRRDRRIPFSTPARNETLNKRRGLAKERRSVFKETNAIPDMRLFPWMASKKTASSGGRYTKTPTRQT